MSNVLPMLSDKRKGISSKKVRGLWHLSEVKRCCFVRFENHQEIKCYIPISFFFAYKKCTEMPIDKGPNAHSEVLKTFEVRY